MNIPSIFSTRLVSKLDRFKKDSEVQPWNIFCISVIDCVLKDVILIEVKDEQYWNISVIYETYFVSNKYVNFINFISLIPENILLTAHKVPEGTNDSLLPFVKNS